MSFWKRFKQCPTRRTRIVRHDIGTENYWTVEKRLMGCLWVNIHWLEEWNGKHPTFESAVKEYTQYVACHRRTVEYPTPEKRR